MEFSNHTPYPAKLLTGSTGEREMIGIIACKVTYRLQNNSLIPVVGEEAWPVFEKPHEFMGVTLAPEVDFRQKGIDILVFGEAVAPRKAASPMIQVSAQCGKICHRVTVIGNRVWQYRNGELRPSDPEPFVRMPLTNDRAFGGSAVLAGAEVLHPINPDGCGFYYQQEQAEGGPLPNLEDPEMLITDWQDKPRPACWHKPAGLLQAKGHPDPPTDDVPAEMLRSVFNTAVPELVAEPQDLGPTLHLTGFSEEGEVVLPVPDLTGPVAVIRIGKLGGEFPATLCTLLALPAEKILIATYRSLFRYLMRPEEARTAELQWPGYAKPDLPEKQRGAYA